MRKNITLAGIAISTLIYGQSNITQDYTTNTNDAGKHIPKISPTSPESFKFSQYGNIPIGMFTGAPNINIPITELSVDGTSIPISLNYASNGINIDEMNGSVGLGWTFISGGVITRTIRDRPDEESNYNSGDVPPLENSNVQMTEYLKFCEVDDFDSEPDLYTANFAGNNVKFLINKSGNIFMIDQKDYKIKRNDNGNLFSIILDNGVRYNFNAVENILNRILNTGRHQPPLQYPQSWYLTSVVTTNGQTLTLEYQDVSYTNTLSQSQSMTYTTGLQQKYGDIGSGPNGGNYCPMIDYVLPPNNIGLIADSEQEVSGKQIKKIYDSNNNSIVFTYSIQNGDYSKLTGIKKYHNDLVIDDFTFNYVNTNSSRLFLTEIHNNKDNSSHKFSYYNPESLPSRLSFSRDMWGYYNGKSNSTLIPQIFDSSNISAPQYNGADQNIEPSLGQYGLLKTIIYPTGGNTLLNYENHKKKDNVLVPATKTNVGISTFNPLGTYETTKETIVIPQKTGLVQIGLSSYLYPYGTCKNSPALQTGKQKASLEVFDQAGNLLTLSEYSPLHNTYFPIGTSTEASVNTNKKVFVNVNKNQPIKIVLTALFACADAYASTTYYDKDDEYVLQDVLLGGYRISSTVDAPTDGLPITRKYNYVNDNGEYSIHQTREPLFKENRTAGSVCIGGSLTGTLPIILNYTAITSSNIGKLFSFNPNIFYDTVEEKIDGKGKTVHYFNSNTDYWGNPIKGSSIISAPWTNSGWDNGKEILTVYKDNTNTIIKKVEFNYAEDTSRTSYMGAITRRKIFEPVLNDGTWNNFENLDAVYYKNISRFTYLKSKKTTDYLTGIPIKTETEYFYNNPSHYQLNRQKTIFPDGKISESVYNYAHEKGNQLMISKNMIGIPLETVSTQTIGNSTKTLSKSETIYPLNQTEANTKTSGLVLPTSVLSYDLQNPATSITEVLYDKYDSKGNLQQYTTKDGVSTVIIWGYHTTKPIAKIENAKLADINPSVINAIVSASDTDGAAGANNDETNLLNAFNTFRNTLSGYQITTYTYDPLIGVRSITPPSGIRESYIYDAAGRLEKVIDANGKVLKEMKYNYKN
ncbi:RHS repeat domain-containing protein [Chryseobacterium sp. NRRL B-14859]|uniref:RHS repeat domain-containing protein n=1 Tax=Chryseobacterium sp. NRRL B-14859 TaxID=1562763 RepID=UPI003391345F